MPAQTDACPATCNGAAQHNTELREGASLSAHIQSGVVDSGSQELFGE